MTWTGSGTRPVGIAAYESHLPGRVFIGIGSEAIHLDADQAETLAGYLAEKAEKVRAQAATV